MTAATDHALAATANAATIVDHPNLLHKILKKKKKKSTYQKIKVNFIRKGRLIHVKTPAPKIVTNTLGMMGNAFHFIFD